MFIYYFLFIKTISLFYSLFVFRISYKIIVLSSLNLAGRGLAGLPIFGPRVWAWNLRAGPGPNIHGLGRAWANYRPAQGTRPLYSKRLQPDCKLVQY